MSAKLTIKGNQQTRDNRTLKRTNGFLCDGSRIILSRYIKIVGSFRLYKNNFNPLTPELNLSAQRCLTRFLLGILFLEQCISLIYA
jgi:hypothetical protein